MASTGSLRTGLPEIYRPKTDLTAGDEPGPIGRIVERMRPDEGWLGVPLILVLAGTMAWSIADARWILGNDGLTSFLILIGLAAASWGYVSARLEMRPWLAHTIGCVIASFVLIEVVGSTLYTGPNGNPVDWFNATGFSVTQAYLDLTWRHQVVTLQVGHFSLVLGILVWATAQAASYDVFGYHRAVNGVLLLSVALIANMALTQNDQFTALVVFSAAALILLLLAHAADERTSWMRHRIWRGREFQAPHLQGGMAFATAAIAGSLILTTVASSAPLGSTFQDLGSQVGSALSWMRGYLPIGGASRIQSIADFGPVAQINPTFHEATRSVFTVRLPDGPVALHWRLVAYDQFQSTAWTIGQDQSQDDVIAGLTLDNGTQDLVGSTTAGRIQVTADVHVQDSAIKHLIAANEPDSVNVTARRTLIGANPDNVNVAWFTVDATDYVVSAYVPNDDPSGKGLTEWRLRHADTEYPPDLLFRYTQGADLVKSNGKALLAEIAGWASSNGFAFDTEYDVAKQIQDYLHSNRFTYNVDLTRFAVQCNGLTTVDCFALVRQGFCEQYATTMTMLMRMSGYPARYVQGYLPGPIDEHSLVQQVTTQQKHAWVEVFFPGYGWIPFDPTGGGVGQPTELVPGSAVTATPTPQFSFTPHSTPSTRASRIPGPSPTAGATTGDNGAAVLVPGLLIGILGLALFVIWRRRPRRQDGAETVYRSVVKLASRLGYKPRPTQTVYEYTGMLAEIVPKAREPLAVVAMATVESTYGRRQLGDERLISLAAAHRLVRQALLRLALRLPRIRRPGRGRGGSRGRKGASQPPRR
jgi:transglutaminase-like putative cysteine protease